jgi:dTDP-4-amino-4,6-dideoxygalactose transaminase
MSIPVFNMAQHLQENRQAIYSAINRVFESNILILGNEVDSFESEFANYLNVPNCIGVANGTDALELAFRALGAKPKTKIGIVGNAGGYSRIAIDLVGSSPVYLPVDVHGFRFSLDALIEFIENRTIDMLVVTHLYGQAHPEILEIARLCKLAQIPLIEDCAQAHGAEVEGIKAGVFGDIATFSFYPTKNLGAMGDGGAIVCSNSQLAQHVRKLAQYGWREKYSIELRGGRNSRLDELQAGILRELLPNLDSWNAKRLIVAKAYLSQIRNPAVVLPNFILESYVGHLFPVQVGTPVAFISHLKTNGVNSSVHYPVEDEAQFAWKNSLHQESIHPTLTPVTLPISQYLSTGEINKVINVVNSYVAEK